LIQYRGWRRLSVLLIRNFKIVAELIHPDWITAGQLRQFGAQSFHNCFQRVWDEFSALLARAWYSLDARRSVDCHGCPSRFVKRFAVTQRIEKGCRGTFNQLTKVTFYVSIVVTGRLRDPLDGQ